MKDRMILGTKADVAETAALTLADERATERIIDALDFEHDERERDIRERRERDRLRQRKSRAVKLIRARLGDAYGEVAKAWFGGKGAGDIGIPERTFRDRLKKVKIFFQPHG